MLQEIIMLGKKPLNYVVRKGKQAAKVIEIPIGKSRAATSCVQSAENSVVATSGRIPPHVFPRKEGPNIFSEYKPFEHLCLKPYNVHFLEEVNPTVLKTKAPKPFATIIEISNFSYPSGSIAASSEFNEYLYTSGFLQCAGAAIVDKSKKVQSLFHCFPGISVSNNRDILRYILSKSNPRDLEVTLVPGCYEDSGKTVAFLKETVEEFAQGAKIKYCNFPHRGDGLLVHNGEVSCYDDLRATIGGFARNKVITNPKEYIIYSK